MVKYIITFLGAKFQFIINHFSIIYQNFSAAEEYICYEYFS